LKPVQANSLRDLVLKKTHQKKKKKKKRAGGVAQDVGPKFKHQYCQNIK
jgi:hypothetical protein